VKICLGAGGTAGGERRLRGAGFVLMRGRWDNV